MSATTPVTGRYVGRPWRSRFLRAPAIAVELAARDDFVALRDIAEVSLGLKTGSDRFFFVTLPDNPRASTLGVPGSRRTIAVESRIGWTGMIGTGDLKPALLNPHRLQNGQARALVVPERMEDAYLYPRDRNPTNGLADYIAAGEREGIHNGDLVQSNATGGRWYRQGRAPVDWRWALPYNSAYDYGAHDNAAHRVLNGRFVGCRPKADANGDVVDEDLLGAVLNSTFTILTRLLEGVSTGSEGAFDVGPPAARLMRIPDPRRMDPNKVAAVVVALDACRAANLMPAAPDRRGDVHDLRRSLDAAVLMALGATAGQAAHQLDVVYSHYARWRSAVEDVEARVRENRRALATAGRGRNESPLDLVARQAWDELYLDSLIFPSAVLPADAELEQVAVAPGFRPPDHEPMFDAGRVQAPNGQSIDLGDWNRVRYAGMLVHLGFRSPLPIPRDPTVARNVVDAYDAGRAHLEREALRLGTQYMGAARAAEVAAAVMRMWRHACHEAGAAAGA